MSTTLTIPNEAIEAFCRKHRVQEFSLFGSVLRDDFRPDSDVDVLVAFAPACTPSLEAWIAMREELATLFGNREIDLVERRRVTNPFRRHEIISTRRVLYAA
ncbi:MAG: nucleotidyltransferase family protein [Phycisphaerales bacterium]